MRVQRCTIEHIIEGIVEAICRLTPTGLELAGSCGDQSHVHGRTTNDGVFETWVDQKNIDSG
jgi:hypothetical protein